MTALKQSKFLSPNNSKKYVTLYGIYLHALPFMERESERLGIRVPKYNKFSFIVRKYLDEVFKLAIFKHKAIQLPQKLGKIFCSKVLCTRYTPHYKYFTGGEDSKALDRRFDVDRFDGYFFVLYLALCKKFSRRYKFDAAKRWKRALFGNVLDGSDYPVIGSMLPSQETS